MAQRAAYLHRLSLGCALRRPAPVRVGSPFGSPIAPLRCRKSARQKRPPQAADSWHRPRRHDPLHRLPGDRGDQVVIAVIVHHSDPRSLSDRGNQQVRQPDRPHLPGAPQRSLDIQRTPPVLVMSPQPLITSVPVSPDLVKLGRAPRRPAQLERSSGARHAWRLRDHMPTLRACMRATAWYEHGPLQGSTAEQEHFYLNGSMGHRRVGQFCRHHSRYRVLEFRDSLLRYPKAADR
jgi:hypothetical protein